MIASSCGSLNGKAKEPAQLAKRAMSWHAVVASTLRSATSSRSNAVAAELRHHRVTRFANMPELAKGQGSR
jgi:hypothetical protein